MGAGGRLAPRPDRADRRGRQAGRRAVGRDGHALRPLPGLHGVRDRLPVRRALRPPDRAGAAAGGAPLRAIQRPTGRCAGCCSRRSPTPSACARSPRRSRPPARRTPTGGCPDGWRRSRRSRRACSRRSRRGGDPPERTAAIGDAARPRRPAAGLRAAGLLPAGAPGDRARAGGRGVRGARPAAAGLLRRARAPRGRGGGGARTRARARSGVRRARPARPRRRQRRRLRLGDEGVRRAARHPGRARIRGARSGRVRAARRGAGPRAARRRCRCGSPITTPAISPTPRGSAPSRASCCERSRSSSCSRSRPSAIVCCGSAGIYNLVQPQAAAELGRRKATHLLETGAEAIAAGNPGCAAQLDLHLRELGHPLPIHHPVELVWRSIAATGRDRGA